MPPKTFKRTLKRTSDGSYTLYVPELDEHYHSIHGARQEAEHVFLKMGLDPLMDKSELNILEIGFGTGLNALLTLDWAERSNCSIKYTGVEKYPVGLNEALTMEYLAFNDLEKYSNDFRLFFDNQSFDGIDVNDKFKLKIDCIDFYDMTYDRMFDVVFYDAFGPRVQPYLWTLELFKLVFKALRKDGILVTYCAKGQVRRDLLTAGFEVERLPGPPGKREMLRAIKHV